MSGFAERRLQKGPSKGEGMSFQVYYEGKSGKKITVNIFDDLAEAKDQLSELRRLYGKYIKAGIVQKVLTRFDRSVMKVKSANEKRKQELGVDVS